MGTNNNSRGVGFCDFDRVLSLAIQRYGTTAQIHMAIEEMAELTNALMKDMRGRVTADDIITEVADVTIMMRQLSLMLGDDKVSAEIERKVNRLETRLMTGSKIPQLHR